MPAKKWTEEEEEFLVSNYATIPNTALAEKFGITKNAVQKKLARMGLKRSKSNIQPPPDEASVADVAEEKVLERATSESHFSLGNKLYYETHNYEQAIEEFRQAAKEESDEHTRLSARYWMAESYAKIGKLEEAVNIFRLMAQEHGDHHLGDSAGRRANALAKDIALSA